MITRGLTTSSLITRGFTGGIPLVLREAIRLISKITFLITGTSEIESTISETSKIDLELD
jgi:hypothetical protein